MHIPTDAALLLFGLVLLVYGGDRAVEAASAIAHAMGVPTLFIGVTLVAVGSSIPEIATTMYAAAYGAGELAVGHIVGSATSQITLGVGVVALLSPLSMPRGKVRTYGGGMILAMSLMGVALWSGRISRPEGLALVLAYVTFIAVRYDHEDYPGAVPEDPREQGLRRSVAFIVVGFALVAVGGHLLVTNATSLAASLGTPPALLGLVTGLGTTAPEIAIAGLAVRRDEGAIAVGTLFGSNITDPLFSLGAGAAVDAIAVEHRAALLAATGYMLAVSAVVVAAFYRRGGLNRPAAMGCLALYLPSFWLV